MQLENYYKVVVSHNYGFLTALFGVVVSAILFTLSAYGFGWEKGHFFFSEEMSFSGQVSSLPTRYSFLSLI